MTLADIEGLLELNEVLVAQYLSLSEEMRLAKKRAVDLDEDIKLHTLTKDNFSMFTRYSRRPSKETVLRELQFYLHYNKYQLQLAKEGLVHYGALERSIKNSENYNEVFKELSQVHGLEIDETDSAMETPPRYEEQENKDEGYNMV